MNLPSPLFRIDIESEEHRPSDDAPCAAVRSWAGPSRWLGLAVVLELRHAFRRYRRLTRLPIGRIIITRDFP